MGDYLLLCYGWTLGGPTRCRPAHGMFIECPDGEADLNRRKSITPFSVDWQSKPFWGLWGIVFFVLSSTALLGRGCPWDNRTRIQPSRDGTNDVDEAP